jgi:hypothetical protein
VYAAAVPPHEVQPQLLKAASMAMTTEHCQHACCQQWAARLLLGAVLDVLLINKVPSSKHAQCLCVLLLLCRHMKCIFNC